jgi:ankyrin repeat protein
MFRIYDFHSSKAPKIKQTMNSFAFFGMGEESDDEEYEIDPAQYESFFHVTVGEDTVYLEDPLGCNELEWSPLHTCCMSFVTVHAGVALIEEYERSGVSLETATLAGPGTFNSQWTALHMACAYGVEPLVDRLVKAGANVNTQNSFGYTPLLEACHRGYLNVVGMLLASGKVDLGYIPDESVALNSPFVSSPPQSALAEAARSGFQKIVQMILDQNCPKDLPNKLGWTALHEACFFNRVETVKTLLLAGCRGDLRTRAGALPYHLASIKMVREMIADMGGEGSVPRDASDVVDMVQVLRELTSMGVDDDDGAFY